jgi:CRP/FNR family transcriptional regulator, anaerobic regulatory protein
VSLEHYFSDYPLQQIPSGTQILHQGDECQHYFMLIAGSVKIFARSVNGREVVLYHVAPGKICVLTTTCLLGNKRFPAEAVAESELSVRIMPKHRFDELMENSAEFRHQVFDNFGQRIGSLIETIEKLALETLEQRLAKYLLLQPCNPVQVTHQDIASEIGSAREVVSRHLKRFETLGFLKLDRGSIELLDRTALHHLI